MQIPYIRWSCGVCGGVSNIAITDFPRALQGGFARHMYPSVCIAVLEEANRRKAEQVPTKMNEAVTAA